MANITPFVKRQRTQGGTLYTFSSATEDIGLNINERNNIVKMSNFALLNIPGITGPTTIQQNKFNVFAIDGALQIYDESGSIKDGKIVVAESFQNYALNLEANLLAQTSYNSNLLSTVSEKVFWKWLKETGAIRWTKDVSNNGYWLEETDTDTSVGYNSVVKYVGEISAGSIRTDNFGTFNETYVLIPTSHGQTKVYFKQNYDDNYIAGTEIGPKGANILGRETYTQPHPDGLSLLGQYDVIDSSTTTGTWAMTVDTSDGNGYTSGWWYTGQGKAFTDDNYYVMDISTAIDASIYNYKLKYDNGAGTTIEFKRSNLDAVNIEYNLDNLKTIFDDSTLTFDKMAINNSIADSFDFNSVLIYYTVYNQALDKILATNLLGILFLDVASGSTSGFPTMEISIPEITKLKSTQGFGTSYSFRVNVKSDNMIDDTQAIIYDESTSAQADLENWSDVFANLNKSIDILNTHTGTINYITEQYMQVLNTQSTQVNSITNLSSQINNISSTFTGTTNTVPLFSGVTGLMIDSSIFMKSGFVGINNTNPKYQLDIDGSTKVKNIIIEDGIYDVSSNLILNSEFISIGDWTFDTSGTMLRLNYDGSTKFIFTTDGSILNN